MLMTRKNKNRKGQQKMKAQFEHYEHRILLFSTITTPQNIVSVTCSKCSITNRLATSNASNLTEYCEDRMLLFPVSTAPQNIPSIIYSNDSIPNRLTTSNTNKLTYNGSSKTHFSLTQLTTFIIASFE